LRQIVQPRLLGAPIELGPPIFREPSQETGLGAIVPIAALDRVGPAGVAQPARQIFKLFVADADSEWCNLHEPPLPTRHHCFEHSGTGNGIQTAFKRPG